MINLKDNTYWWVQLEGEVSTALITHKDSGIHVLLIGLDEALPIEKFKEDQFICEIDPPQSK